MKEFIVVMAFVVLGIGLAALIFGFAPTINNVTDTTVEIINGLAE